jgi:L-alanine-DL-glutamate epimerase-like enolase superfamily enzyme
MRITDVEAHVLSSPVDPPQTRTFHGGRREILKRDAILATVETSDGTVGYAPGLATSSAMKEFFSELTHDSVTKLLNNVLSVTLRDVEFEDPADVIAAIDRESLPEELVWQAKSIVDVALYDIVGKVHGAPIYELLGDDDDATRSLSLYASGGMYMSPDEYTREARQVAREGFFGYKYRPGIGPDGDRRTIDRIVDELDGEIEVMADAHTWWKMGPASYDEATVHELVEYFDDRGVYWVEEPVEPSAYGSYRSLRERTDAPLAGGESEAHPEGLVELADTGAVDFLQGDVRHHGGYTGCWDVVEHCADRGLRFVPHNFGTHLGLVANGHLTAADPGNALLEYPVYGDEEYPGMYPYPVAEEILQTDLDVADGTLRMPDGPGLGVEVDTDVVERYPRIDGPWTTFHYD